MQLIVIAFHHCIFEHKIRLARTDADWIFKSPAERAEAIAQKTATDLAVQIAKNNQNIARDAVIKAQVQNEIYNHPKLNPVQALMRKIAYFSDQSGIQSIEAIPSLTQSMDVIGC